MLLIFTKTWLNLRIHKLDEIIQILPAKSSSLPFLQSPWNCKWIYCSRNRSVFSWARKRSEKTDEGAQGTFGGWYVHYINFSGRLISIYVGQAFRILIMYFVFELHFYIDFKNIYSWNWSCYFFSGHPGTSRFRRKSTNYSQLICSRINLVDTAQICCLPLFGKLKKM